jgi:hypothetical protein
MCKRLEGGVPEIAMFRITQYLQEVLYPTPVTPRRDPPGPVVIWNLIRRCNLACQHCYSISAIFGSSASSISVPFVDSPT